MDSNERQILVEEWIKFQYAERDSLQKEQLLWAEHKLWLLTNKEPKLAWELILKILESDSSNKILRNLSAGPLEDILSEHGEKFIDCVEQEAKSNKRFRVLLAGVWQGGMSDVVWNRVKASAEGKW